MGRITGFKSSTTGLDVGIDLVEKSYLIDRYPELADTFKQAGLWTWGYNGYGQLGDGTVGNDGDTDNSKSSPVQTVAGGTNWKQVSCGSYNIGGIKTDGTLWIWGLGSSGQLGHNLPPPVPNWEGVSSPIQTVAGGTNWKQLSIGLQGSSAIKTDGTLWSWGVNIYGELGDNSRTNRSSPVQTVSGGTNWKQVSFGNSFVGAIKTDGTLWTWGYNFYGQLGNNDRTDRSSPVQTVAGGTNWKQVSSSNANSVAAIKTDGTLWTWGNNNAGQLGDNTIVDKSSPVQTVAGGTNWKQVSSSNACAAIKTDGTLWLWGANNVGQLGNNTTTNRSSPVQTVAGGTNWKQVSSGGAAIGAIKTDGTLWTWGYGYNGELGTNNRTDRSSPVQTVAGGTNWKQFDCCGGNSVAAIRDDSADIFGNPV